MAATICDLPFEMLEEIFGFLSEAKDICNVSETCVKFRNIVDNSDHITRKLTLYMNYPEDLSNFTQRISQSTRRYRRLKINKKQQTREDTVRSPQRGRNDIFSSLNQHIEVLTIHWSNLMNTREVLFEFHSRGRLALALRNGGVHEEANVASRAVANARENMFNDFIGILGTLNNIQELNLHHVHLDRLKKPTDQDIILNRLTRLHTKECDGYCYALLKNVRTLTKLHVTDTTWASRTPGISEFENFLFAQSQLKDLKLANFFLPRFLQRDKTSEISFKLDHLVLRNVYFSNKEITNEFFRTQDQLKSINFQICNEKVRNLDEINFFNNPLRSIVSGRNSNLKTIVISKEKYKMEECDFLDNISNSTVKVLKYHVSSEDNSFELFKKLINIFTRLEVVEFKADVDEEPNDREACFGVGTVLTNVHTMIIQNSSVRSLVNVFAPMLTIFKYTPDSPGEFIDNFFVGFFHRHRNIKKLEIGNKDRRSYVFVTLALVGIITNYLEHLEHITIYNFESVNKSIKLLCEMSQLKSITISTEDYQQFTAKTKVECSRKNLKLIHVNVGAKPMTRDFHLA